MTSDFLATSQDYLHYLAADALWPRVLLGVTAYIAMAMFTGSFVNHSAPGGFGHGQDPESLIGILAVLWPITVTGFTVVWSVFWVCKHHKALWMVPMWPIRAGEKAGKAFRRLVESL